MVVAKLIAVGEFLLVIKGHCISVLDAKTGGVVRLWEGKASLTPAVAVNEKGTVLALADFSKHILLLGLEIFEGKLKLKDLARGKLEKGAMVIRFEGEEAVLVGDKFGDLVRFELPRDVLESPWKGQVIAGCVSIVTDLQIDTRRKHCVIADRDEKIRRINIEPPFAIHDFLLEHGEYVAAVELVLGGERLISVGGDGKVLLWTGLDKEPTVIASLKFGEAILDPIQIKVDHALKQIYIMADKIYVVDYTESTLTQGKLLKTPELAVLLSIELIGTKLYLAGLNKDRNSSMIYVSADGMWTELAGLSIDTTTAISIDQILKPFLRKRRALDDFSRNGDDDEDES